MTRAGEKLLAAANEALEFSRAHHKRVLVCGGRNYGNIKAVFDTLDQLQPEPELIIHGSASGADRIAQTWSDSAGVCCLAFPAKWRLHGRAAGPIRNQAMIDEGKPDLVIAFPGGAGTADMVRRAREARIPIMQVVG